MNLFFRVERVEEHPRAGEARSKVTDRLGLIQRIQGKVCLGELALAEPRAEGVDGVVAARHILGQVQMRQQGGTRQTGRSGCVVHIGLRHRGLGVFAQGAVDRLPQRQRLLRGSSRAAPGQEQRHGQRLFQSPSHRVKILGWCIQQKKVHERADRYRLCRKIFKGAQNSTCAGLCEQWRGRGASGDAGGSGAAERRRERAP